MFLGIQEKTGDRFLAGHDNFIDCSLAKFLPLIAIPDNTKPLASLVCSAKFRYALAR
jgi:hypothetical protein